MIVWSWHVQETSIRLGGIQAAGDQESKIKLSSLSKYHALPAERNILEVWDILVPVSQHSAAPEFSMIPPAPFYSYLYSYQLSLSTFGLHMKINYYTQWFL